MLVVGRKGGSTAGWNLEPDLKGHVELGGEGQGQGVA